MLVRRNILCCGRDALLLETRRRLLESKGFPTDVALGLVAAVRKLAKGDFTLLVLCHTLAEKDCGEIVRLHRIGNTSAPVLLLTTDRATIFDTEAQTCDIAEGPAGFLASAEKALRQGA